MSHTSHANVYRFQNDTFFHRTDRGKFELNLVHKFQKPQRTGPGCRYTTEREPVGQTMVFKMNFSNSKVEFFGFLVCCTLEIDQ